jgi:hypothetical protein
MHIAEWLHVRNSALLPLVLVGALAPAGLGAQGVADPSSRIFDRDRVLEVEIRMDPTEWHALRISHRDAGDAGFARMAEVPYVNYPADLWIDGVHIGRVAVRKKGFFGSVVSTRPSLKVSFDEYERGRTFAGLNGLTLNNNTQDASLVQQVMAYDLYARAGVPAPRAGYARVRVNDEDLGVYSNVEAINNRFLRRVFGSSSGGLFESYAGDFTDDSFFRIVDKRGDLEGGRRQLDALKALLAQPGALELAEVEALVDLRSFIRMWAMESLMGHWDGYSANSNNIYLYVHHETGRIHFLPWGADDLFADPGPLQTKVVPKSFKAEGLLARRLWEVAEVRERYRIVMRELLVDVWHESRLLSDIASMQAMLAPRTTLSSETLQVMADTIAMFITQRRAEVGPELMEPAPLWPAHGVALLPGQGESLSVPVRLTASFTAPWLTEAPEVPLGQGSATIQVQIGDEQPITLEQAGVYASAVPQAHLRAGYHSITLAGMAGTQMWQVLLWIDPFRIENGRSLPVDHFAAWALIFIIDDPELPPRVSIFGNVGELAVERAEPAAGGVFSGTVRLQGIRP